LKIPLGEERGEMKRICLIILLLMATAVVGCGGIRFSQETPEAKDFHPRGIAVLPVGSAFPQETTEAAEKVLAEVVADRDWFARVVSSGDVRKIMSSSGEAKKILTDYLDKVKSVNFSDPDLSRKMGELLQVDAFLICDIDLWNYNITGVNKSAHVGMSMKLIEAGTGTVMWKAVHNEAKEYRFFKPNLSSMGKSLAQRMIRRMPH
jgi:hypothetical protein